MQHGRVQLETTPDLKHSCTTTAESEMPAKSRQPSDSRRRHADSIAQAAVQMFANGSRTKDVALALNIPYSTAMTFRPQMDACPHCGRSDSYETEKRRNRKSYWARKFRKNTPSLAARKWTQLETQTAHKLADGGMSIAEIAEHMNRTPASVRKRLWTDALRAGESSLQ